MVQYVRFLKSSKNEYSSVTDRVKYPAFFPNWETDAKTARKFLSKSIFNIDGLPESGIWNLADQNVMDKKIEARGDIQDSVILKIGLKIDPNNIPPRHANILGWDESENETAREKNKSFAINLADDTKLVLRDS